MGFNKILQLFNLCTFTYSDLIWFCPFCLWCGDHQDYMSVSLAGVISRNRLMQLHSHFTCKLHKADFPISLLMSWCWFSCYCKCHECVSLLNVVLAHWCTEIISTCLPGDKALPWKLSISCMVQESQVIVPYAALRDFYCKIMRNNELV